MRYTVRRFRKWPPRFCRTRSLRTQRTFPRGLTPLAYYIVIVLCFKQVLVKML